MNRTIPRSAIVCLLCLLLPAGAALAISDSPQTFRDAYYLETHDRDLAGAIAGYEQVVASGDASGDVVAEAKRRLAGCREELRSADLAALMPPDAIAFVELNRPGDHLERVLALLGLTAEAGDTAGAGDPRAVYPVPGEPDLVIPRRIVISGALLREIKAFQGVAVALTDLDFAHEQPHGVAILHPGDVDLLRGLIETGVQFVKPAVSIRGFRTIEIRDADFSATLVFTNRLVIAGTQRALVEGVVARLQEDQPSLATNDVFSAQRDARKNAVLFAFVNAQEGLKRFQQAAARDDNIAQGLAFGQAFFDLAHLNSLALGIGAAEDGLSAEFVMAMADGQMNLAYNLLRTPPMRGEVLRMVPAGAAAVFAVGVNPAGDLDEAARIDARTQSVQAITGLDLGRELFSNIREVAVYVLPPKEGEAGPERRHDIPHAALIAVVGDPEKSAALWDFLLSLPGKVAGGTASPPTLTQFAGVEVRGYPLEKGTQLFFARTGSCIVVGATQDVVAATLTAAAGEHNLTTDIELQKATSRIGPDTSVAMIGHIGRLARMAGSYAPAQEAQIFKLISQAASRTTATVTIDEAPTRLHVAAKLTNLPKVEHILDALARAGVFAPPANLVTQAE